MIYATHVFLCLVLACKSWKNLLRKFQIVNFQEFLPFLFKREFLCDPKFSDEEDLEEKLAVFKEKYMEFDLNNHGEIDLMSVKRMMEKLGTPKTHLELKKMISEVTGGISETISYQDFVTMMLGKRSAVLKLVMMFEGKSQESTPKCAGPPPERDLSSLP
ncbi:allograft inflammatory factor 1-like isoform X1 [Ahaetulla prasina]|uniref:allograft inflammatory factor 1-like isoform X1 n=1 Tax=Ahaetulla prasina TaxID=499056 RepID=UPI0026495449|nr:allograft inflammatory factor 1-like isoform X1 [Ahaetulla prasina]